MKEEIGTLKVVRAAAADDPEALARLYELYAGEVYGVAYALTLSAADAYDVVQEVFIGLPEALRTYEARGPFGAWISQVATRKALMLLRARRRRNEVSLSTTGWYPVRSTPPPDVVNRLALDRALAQLPERYRIVFVLHEIEGWTHQEIGDLLGITWQGSGQRLYRAMRTLRKLLEEGQ